MLYVYPPGSEVEVEPYVPEYLKPAGAVMAVMCGACLHFVVIVKAWWDYLQ